MKKNILIVGSGAREDALIWKLRQSKQVGTIYISPGNGGSIRFRMVKQLPYSPVDLSQIVNWTKKNNIDLVVVGGEEPLVKGIVDLCLKNNISVFGPTKKAAFLESSKADAIFFMDKYNIPHPKSKIFNSFKKAINYIKSKKLEIKNGLVIKVDGLAQGKGVFIVYSQNEAEKVLRKIMIDNEFGKAGTRVVIQEKLNGFEASLTLITDVNNYLILPYSEDHKQVFDKDRGPNTGGMGVVAPHPEVSKSLKEKIRKLIIRPTIEGLKKEGIEFRGVLYPGLMITKGKPYVLEYNVRFGDPETEAILPLLSEKIDFFKVLLSASKGKLLIKGYYPTKKGVIVVVALASKGYPGSYQKGEKINLNKISKNALVFHAGTKVETGGYMTSGGRVLMIASRGKTLGEARKNVYKIIGKDGIYFSNMHYRKDIGARKR